MILMCLMMVSIPLYSQHYRCAGEYLEAHPFECDLFIVDETDGEPLAILLCRRAISGSYSSRLERMRDVKPDLIIAGLKFKIDRKGKIFVKNDCVYYLSGKDMLRANKKNFLLKAWHEVVSDSHFEMLYGNTKNMPKRIRLVFFLDKNGNADIPDKFGQLSLNPTECERRLLLLRKIMGKANVFIPKLKISFCN